MNKYRNSNLSTTDKIDFKDESIKETAWDITDSTEEISESDYSIDVMVDFIVQELPNNIPLPNIKYFLSSIITNTKIDYSPPYNEDDILNSNQRSMYDYLSHLLEFNIEREKGYLEEEGIELPDNMVKESTLNVIYFLAYKNIFPDRITTSSEGGLCLVFNNEDKRLFLELYNEGDIGYIIEDIKTKKLIENKDINTLNELINRLIKFFS